MLGNYKRDLTKSKRWESDEYLDWVRAHGCCCCMAPAPSEPHHWGPDKAGSRVASDVYAAPLCHNCHLNEWHQFGHFRGMSRSESEKVLLRGQVMCLAGWVMFHGDKLEARKHSMKLLQESLEEEPF